MEQSRRRTALTHVSCIADPYQRSDELGVQADVALGHPGTGAHPLKVVLAPVRATQLPQ